MKLVGETKINASREVVFAALNDTDILQKAIPGCEEIVKISDTEMTAIVVLKVGPVKAKFKGAIQLSNLNPPEGYSITGEGKAGPAGGAKGGADVKLVQDGNGTILHYDVNAKVMGKFAQLGNRLIDSTAKKLSAQFFEKFAEIVEEKAGTASEPSGDVGDLAETNSSMFAKPGFWIAAAVIAVVIIAAWMF